MGATSSKQHSTRMKACEQDPTSDMADSCRIVLEMEKELAVSRRSQQRRCREAAKPQAVIRTPGNSPAEDGRVRLRIADNPILADLVTPALELGLDEDYEAGAGPQRTPDGRNDLF